MHYSLPSPRNVAHPHNTRIPPTNAYTSTPHNTADALQRQTHAESQSAQPIPHASAQTRSYRSGQDPSFKSTQSNFEHIYYPHSAALHSIPKSALAPPIYAMKSPRSNENKTPRSFTSSHRDQTIPASVNQPTQYYQSFTGERGNPGNASFAYVNTSRVYDTYEPTQIPQYTPRNLPIVPPQSQTFAYTFEDKATHKKPTETQAQVPRQVELVEKEPNSFPAPTWDSVADMGPDHPYYGPWKYPVWGMKKSSQEYYQNENLSQSKPNEPVHNGNPLSNSNRIFGDAVDTSEAVTKTDIPSNLFSTISLRRFQVKVIDARGLVGDSSKVSRPDLYCLLQCGSTIKQSKILRQASFNPVWNESFMFEAEDTDELVITVKHHNQGDNDVDIGSLTIQVEDILQEQKEKWFPLQPKGELHIRLLQRN